MRVTLFVILVINIGVLSIMSAQNIDMHPLRTLLQNELLYIAETILSNIDIILFILFTLFIVFISVSMYRSIGGKLFKALALSLFINFIVTAYMIDIKSSKMLFFSLIVNFMVTSYMTRYSDLDYEKIINDDIRDIRETKEKFYAMNEELTHKYYDLPSDFNILETRFDNLKIRVDDITKKIEDLNKKIEDLNK